MGDWQPIETAPRDGTDIIVWDGEVRTVTLWGKVSHVPIFGFLGVWGSDIEDVDLMNPQPTHWMPMPNPPSGPKQGQVMPWEDREDNLTPAIEADPKSKDFNERYSRALQLVGNRHSKASLVSLVAYLLKQGGRRDDAL